MPETLDRRQFSVAAALALLGGASITIGCGGGSGNPTAPAPARSQPPAPVPAPTPPGDVSGSVSSNHPLRHSAVITAAQLGAGGALILNIQGEAFHSHTVSLAGAQVTQIAVGARISQQSSLDPHSDGTGSHSHTVTFN